MRKPWSAELSFGVVNRNESVTRNIAAPARLPIAEKVGNQCRTTIRPAIANSTIPITSEAC